MPKAIRLEGIHDFKTLENRLKKDLISGRCRIRRTFAFRNLNSAERPGFDLTRIRNLLQNLCLSLNAGDFKDLARLEDVLKLHGFLPSIDAD